MPLMTSIALSLTGNGVHDCYQMGARPRWHNNPALIPDHCLVCLQLLPACQEGEQERRPTKTKAARSLSVITRHTVCIVRTLLLHVRMMAGHICYELEIVVETMRRM